MLVVPYVTYCLYLKGLRLFGERNERRGTSTEKSFLVELGTSLSLYRTPS